MAQVSEMSTSSTEVSSQDDERLAKVSYALAEIATWLLDSPNNPDYPESDIYKRFASWLDRHQGQIGRQYYNALARTNFVHAGEDLARLGQLRYGELQPAAFHAYDIAYAGDVGTAVDTFRETTERDGVNTINDNACVAISGTLGRSDYLEQLSAGHPAVRLGFGERPFIGMYRQNILATIQLASRLELEAMELELSQSTGDPGPDLRLVA